MDIVLGSRRTAKEIFQTDHLLLALKQTNYSFQLKLLEVYIFIIKTEL